MSGPALTALEVVKDPVLWKSSPGDVYIVWTEASGHELNAGSSFDRFHCLRDCQPVVPIEVGGEDIGDLERVFWLEGVKVEELDYLRLR